MSAQNFLQYLGYALMIVSGVSALIIAPLSKSWLRCFCFAVIPTSIWSLLRIVSISVFREESPPMIGFIVVPIAMFLYATAFRLCVLGAKRLWCLLRR